MVIGGRPLNFDLNCDGVFSKYDLKHCMRLNDGFIFLKTIIDGYENWGGGIMTIIYVRLKNMMKVTSCLLNYIS